MEPKYYFFLLYLGRFFALKNTFNIHFYRTAEVSPKVRLKNVENINDQLNDQSKIHLYEERLSKISQGLKGLRISLFQINYIGKYLDLPLDYSGILSQKEILDWEKSNSLCCLSSYEACRIFRLEQQHLVNKLMFLEAMANGEKNPTLNLKNRHYDEFVTWAANHNEQWLQEESEIWAAKYINEWPKNQWSKNQWSKKDSFETWAEKSRKISGEE